MGVLLLKHGSHGERVGILYSTQPFKDMELQRNNSKANPKQHQNDDWDEVHSQMLAVQKKSLEISKPGDADEEEADMVARKVMNGQNAIINGSSGGINRKGDGNVEAGPEFQSQLENSKGSGEALPSALQEQMGSKMGADFGDVKVHTGDEAVTMSNSINAKAFTSGNDIYFNKGQYDPQSRSGQELIAHELVHTKQQAEDNGIRRKIHRAKLSDFVGAEPTDAQIKTTTEYKDLVNPNNIWQWQVTITASEALYACRLMLKTLNEGGSVDWSNDTRDYLWEARRRTTRGVSIDDSGKGGLGTYLQNVKSGTQAATLAQLKIWTLASTFRQVLNTLSSPELTDVIKTEFPTGSTALESIITSQVDIVVNRYNKYHKEHTSNKDPAGLKTWETEMGVTVNNPYIGVTRQVIDAVYRASMVTEQPPEILLALWVKEGKVARMGEYMSQGVYDTNPYNPGYERDLITVPGTYSEQDAKSYLRSYIFYWNMGTDHYAAFIKYDTGDNVLNMDFTKHAPAFRVAVQDMKDRGFLRRDFSISTMDSTIVLKKNAYGQWTGKPTAQFFQLSLELTSAYFSSLLKNKYAELDNNSPSIVMNYSQWNMGEERFGKHMMTERSEEAGGLTGSALENWILHEDPTPGDAAKNMIKFGMYLKAYKLLFE